MSEVPTPGMPLLLAAFEELPIGVSVFDRELHLLFTNRQFRELLGFPEALCRPGENLAALFRFNAERGEYGSGDIEAQVAERVARARAFEAHSFERRRPDGCVIEIVGRPLPEGGFITTYTDITARKLAEEALLASRAELEQRVADRTRSLRERERELSAKTALLELTLEHMDQGITFVNQRFELELMNARTLELLDLPAWISRPGTTFEQIMRFNAERGEYGPGDVDALVRERVRAASERTPHRLQRLRPNGMVIEVRGRPLPDGGFVTTYTDVTDRQLAEDKLRSERDRLRSLIDGIPGGVTFFDASLRLVAYNRQFVDLLDFGELLKRNPTPTLEEFARFNAERGEYGEGDIDERVRYVVGRAREAKPHLFERTRPNGVVLEVRGAPLAEGGFVTIYTDITHRRETERELLKRTTYLTEIIAHIPVGLTVFDENLKLKYWNDEAVRVLDLPRDAVYRDVPFADLIRFPAMRGEYGPGDPDEQIQARVAMARQFKAHRFERTRPNGKTHLINGSPMQVGDRVAGFITTYSDITDRKRDEAAIRNLLGMQRAILDSADYAIIATDPKGIVLEFNRAAERMLGYTAEQVVGVVTPAKWHDSNEIRTRAVALSATLGRSISPGFETFVSRAAMGHSETQEWRWVRADGRHFPVLLSVSPVLNPEGEIIGFVGIGRDITREKRAEEEVRNLNESLERRVTERTEALARANSELRQATERLVQSEKLAALGRLVAGVAHELNTPLGTMLTMASATSDRVEAFRQTLATSPLRRSTFDQFVTGIEESSRVIERNAQRAARLIEDFKEMASDQTSMRRRSFGLRRVIEELLSALTPTLKRARLQIDLQVDDGLTLDSYPGPIEQIVENLVMNALNHAFEPGQGGCLSIVAERLDETSLGLRISDNGKGMDEEVLRHAFDPFFTTKLGQGGTGLGLYLVYGLATGPLGGEVSLDSRVGEGCNFRFRFPFVAPAFQPAEA